MPGISMTPGHKNTSAQNGPSPFNLTCEFNNIPNPPQIKGNFKLIQITV